LAGRVVGAGLAGALSEAAERIEAQACGWLLNHHLEATEIEPFIQPLNEIIGLAGLAVRYTQLDFVARPSVPGSMAVACDAAFAATDPLRLAQQLFQAASSRDALNVVDWGLATFS